MDRFAKHTALVCVTLLPALGCGTSRKGSARPLRDLRTELLRMARADQEIRSSIIKAGSPRPSDISAVREVDQGNTARMREIVERHGWPGRGLAGADGAEAAWLLVQHADQDLEFQRRCLSLLEDAVAKGDASPKHLAYLKDRVLVAEGRKQLYGTQFRVVGGELVPEPIEDEAGVDSRRAAVGLPTLDEYRKLMKQVYSTPEAKAE